MGLYYLFIIVIVLYVVIVVIHKLKEPKQDITKDSIKRLFDKFTKG